MIASWMAAPRIIDVPCTIEIEHTRESLHAHVELAGDISVEPGDQVVVHGEPIRAAFGERILVRRHATIVRAGPVERLRTRLLAYLELTELYEVGFSAGRHS
jgi:hypothetical protein